VINYQGPDLDPRYRRANQDRVPTPINARGPPSRGMVRPSAHMQIRGSSIITTVSSYSQAAVSSYPTLCLPCQANTPWTHRAWRPRRFPGLAAASRRPINPMQTRIIMMMPPSPCQPMADTIPSVVGPSDGRNRDRTIPLDDPLRPNAFQATET
jgi:hypothetical protein